MNLYFRLFFIFLTARYKQTVSMLDSFTTEHRVLPNDLDLLGHMNNGRYFTVTDLTRIEMLIRAGLWQQMRRLKIHPVMAGETVQFRKPLKPFQRYSIVTKTLGWDEKFIYVEHLFKSQYEVHAMALVKVRVIGKDSTRVAPHKLLKLVHNTDIQRTNMKEAIIKWNLATQSHWKAFN